MKCKKCGKPIKENTDGNAKYCQGHSIWVDKCKHSWVDADNEGIYGQEECRFCGKKSKK